ncbi:MAG: hypothetical protein ABEK16_04460 [Candidatus Nanohalobium sp.]
MELHIPEEPEKLKEEPNRKIEEDRENSSESIDHTSFQIGWRKDIQSYLWKEWKDALKAREINWQKFLKYFSIEYNSVEKWLNGEISWEELIEETRKKIDEIPDELI